MADEKKNDPKKNASNSIILIIMGVILALLLVENFLQTKMARISFSYQLEHLVNLDLVQPEESRKTASSNNLVTFSGKFREQETEEGKNRFKYLELLDESHELQMQEKRLDEELALSKRRVVDAANLYLKISGEPIPASGFRVFDEIFDTPDHQNHIIITHTPEKSFASLKDIEHSVSKLNSENIQNQEHATQLSDNVRDLQILLKNLRSPLLGIGNEAIKQELRQLDAAIAHLPVDKSAAGQVLSTVKETVQSLKSIVAQLGEEKDHLRLRQLRSVRRYKETVDDVVQLTQKIEDNKAKFEKVQQAVGQAVWFFNNQELST
ncbi:MAG: ftsH, partial [Chlamydiia bacterium]|nr:ftsH [Chlamydiia bacterium]